MASMVLPEILRVRLVDLARHGAPDEVCGYVAGQRTEPLTACAVYPVHNALKSPTAFALDGQSMIEVEQQIDRDGLEVLAVFHSHPTSSAKPSPRDLADASDYDPHGSLVHLIVSLAGDNECVRGWSYASESHVEVTLLEEVAT